MNDYMHDGSPTWLAAYPNDGTYDWFGLRFYRQALRVLLVRGAAANSFTTAKTLIYYGAVAYSFRQLHGLNERDLLSESQLSEWKLYYQIANYLYIVQRQSSETSAMGGGFTGAATEFDEHFKSFYMDEIGTYDIRRSIARIYPPKREWGYLVQFWLPPIRYFRCILNVESCTIGEYASHCFDTLSKQQGWETFLKVLANGVIQRSELSDIQSIIESKTLNLSEKDLAKQIIFDGDGINSAENHEYQKGFNLLASMKHKGLEGFSPKTQEDYAMMFSYSHLANIVLGPADQNWKMLISSVIFDIGVSRLYTWLGSISHSEVLDENKLDTDLVIWAQKWMHQNGFSGRLIDVIHQWKTKYLGSINSYNALFESMLDYQNLDSAFEGIVQSIIIAGIPFDEKIQDLDHFQRITDKYHRFAPQRYFNDKTIDLKLSFEAYFLKFTKDLINNQYKFGLERMGMGQKAKQILNYYEEQKQFVYQVDDRKFYENRGIYDMIGATVSTWESAGVF